ncbi:MAG TPA: ectonucleotide pyrophosphatase/phosphodiesterase [Flavobacteriaceae bacterium]|nr:ectonucleotide pyrophosphatase/phosphodiesterase [Flavobacteriaceae bacterium]
MTNRNLIFRLLLIFAVITMSSCKGTASLMGSSPKVNSEASLQKPYLVLVSLDGFRWDYVQRFNPPYLSNFIKNGVKAESLIPSFPSKTFPNHYTIATGMYPDNHGILENSFYSYEKKVTYTTGNRKMVEDGSFYGGTPIWVQAAKAGMVTASYFFVGSEADIQGIRPTYYFRYDGHVKKNVRVAQALKWLNLPSKKRPHLITMYFSDMDDIGHTFGPNNNAELKKGLFELDNALGDLFKGVKKTGLPVNIIIVSDHGMMEIPIENYIPVETVKNDDLYLTIDNGAIVNIHPKNNSQIDSIYKLLKGKEVGNHFKVYKTKETPGFEYIPQNKNWGALQIIPDYGYYFSSSKTIALRKESNRRAFGQHGIDPIHKEMQGIFYANGPDFKKGYVMPSFKNIDVYPLMCKILGLEIPTNIDGSLDKLKNVLTDDE